MIGSRASCVVLVGVLALAGCGGANHREEAPGASAAGLSSADVNGTVVASPAAEQVPVPGDRLLVKRASLELEVEDLGDFARDARRIAKECGGFVQSAWSSDRRLSATLRVARLDDCLAALEKLGEVESRSVSAEDVTTQVVDLDARRANLAAFRDRLRRLLEKAANVGETIAVEKELARVQGELDALDATLKHLRSSAALSEVSVAAEEPRILGPLGYLGYGIFWVMKKLFVIR